MKSKYRNILLITVLLSAFSVAVFYKTLFYGEVFAWYNDQLFQHNVFYKEWYQIVRESIESRNLMVYSWNTFLGTDFLVSKLMYCVGDYLITPFFIIYSGEVNFDVLFAVTSVLSIVISGICMYLYLDKLGIRKEYLLFSLSIVYALSGFVMTYTGSYMFHRFYSLLPLLFYCVENYIQDGKIAGFSLITCILFVQSYELLFSTCFFLVLYFIVSFKLHFDLEVADILKKSVVLILSFFVGLLLSGFVIVPLFLFIVNNPRVGSLSADGLFWDYRTLTGFITSSVIPAFNFRSDVPKYLFYGANHYGSEFGYFTTVLYIPSFCLLTKKGSLKDKRPMFWGEIVIVACLLIKPLNMVIHGLSVPTLRWSFLLAFYHLFATAYILERYEYDASLWKCLSICYGIYICIYVLFLYFYGFNESVCLNILLFAIVYLYDQLLAHGRKKMVAIISMATIGVFYVLSVYSVYGVYGKGEDSFNREFLRYMQDTDNDKMARYYFDSDELWPYSWLNLNSSLDYEYMSVTTYDSTYESVLSDYLHDNGYDGWMIDIDDPDMWRMLGVKYYASSGDSVPAGAKHVNDLDNFKVYELPEYRGIAYCLEDGRNMTVIEYNRQYMKGVIDSGTGTVFVGIPYSSGWNVVDQNGEGLETRNVCGGFLGVSLLDDTSQISFYYRTPGLKAGLVLTFAGFVLFIGEIIYERKVFGSSRVCC